MLKGRDRVESDRFIALRSHYGFDSFFCQPGIKGSHEKGGVEGEVGRFRRRHLVPVPHVASMAELNELLAARRWTRRSSGRIAHRRITVGEHFALEAHALRPLPAERFDVTVVELASRGPQEPGVGPRCLYSVPAALRRPAGRCPRRRRDRRGARRRRSWPATPGPAKATRCWCWTTTSRSWPLKPGAMLRATAAGPGPRRRARSAATHERFWTEARRRLGDRDGTRALIEVLLAARHHARRRGRRRHARRRSRSASIDPAVVAIEARKHARATRPRPVVPIGDGLARFDRPRPPSTDYDDLLEAQ